MFCVFEPCLAHTCRQGVFAVLASREPKMDRLRPAMLIAALVVGVGRRLTPVRPAYWSPRCVSNPHLNASFDPWPYPQNYSVTGTVECAL